MHQPLLIWTVVVVLCCQAESRYTVVRSSTSGETRSRTSLTNKVIASNGSSEKPANTNATGVINLQNPSPSSDRDKAIGRKDDERPSLKRLTSAFGNSSGSHNVVFKMRRRRQSDYFQWRMDRMKLAEKSQEKLIIVYANGSEPVHRDQPYSSAPSESFQEGSDEITRGSNKTDAADAISREPDPLSYLELDNKTGASVEDYEETATSEESPTVDVEHVSLTTELYTTTQDGANDDVSTPYFDDYVAIERSSESDRYTRSPVEDDFDESSNESIYLTTTLQTTNTTNARSEEIFTTTTSLVSLENTSALPRTELIYLDEEGNDLDYDDDSLNDPELPDKEVNLSTAALNHTTQSIREMEDEPSFLLLEPISNIVKYENTTENKDIEKTTISLPTSNQTQIDNISKHLPTETSFSREPTSDTSLLKPVFEIFNNKNNEPRPFSILEKPESDGQHVEKPSKRYVNIRRPNHLKSIREIIDINNEARPFSVRTTDEIDHSEDIDFSEGLKNSREAELKPVTNEAVGHEYLSFISAIANMGENIALLHSPHYDPETTDDPETSDDSETSQNMYLFNHTELGKQLTDSEDFPEYSSGTYIDTTKYDELSSDLSAHLMSSSLTNPLIKDDTRTVNSQRRRDDSLDSEGAGRENHGSVWIGLGAYFKNDKDRFYDDDYVKNLIRQGNREEENVDFDYSDEDYNDSEIDEEEWFNGIEKKMKHASLDDNFSEIDKRSDESDWVKGRYRGDSYIVRSDMFFGEKPNDIIKNVRRKKYRRAKKRKVKGNPVKTDEMKQSDNFEILTLGDDDKKDDSVKTAKTEDEGEKDSTIMMGFYNVIEKIGQELGQDVTGGYGLVGSRIRYDGLPGLIFFPKGTFTVRARQGPNRRGGREQGTVPQAVTVPQTATVPRTVTVPQTVKVPQTATVSLPVHVKLLRPELMSLPSLSNDERTNVVPVKMARQQTENPVLVQIAASSVVPLIKPYVLQRYETHVNTKE